MARSVNAGAHLDRPPDLVVPLPHLGVLQAAGVLWLMIGLLVLQIVVVWAWGVEPRNRVLEDVAVASA